MSDAAGGRILWDLDIINAPFNEKLDQASARAKGFGAVVDETAAQTNVAFDSMTGSAAATGVAVSGAGEKAAVSAPEIRASGAAAAEAGGGFAALKDTVAETLIPLAALFLGYKAFEEIFKDVNEETNLYNSSQVQIINTLKNTKDAVGLNIKQLDEMAESTAKGTTFTAAANLQAESTLLNYKAIGSTVFPIAVAQIDNVATAMANIRGRPVASLQDAAMASRLLGKALENPSTGVNALTRVGIKFSQQQVDQIKTMQAAGDTIGAQKQFMQDLTEVVGGKAVAATQTYQGKILLLQKAVYEFGTHYIKGLQDIVLGLGNTFGHVATALLSNKTVLTILEGAFIALSIFGIGGLIIALGNLVIAAVVAFGTIEVLGSPLFIVAGIVALVGGGIALLVDHFGGFSKVMQDLKGPIDDVKNVFNILMAAILGDDPTVSIGPKWRSFAKDLYPIQVASLLVQDAFKVLKDIFSVFVQLFKDAEPTLKAIGKFVGETLEGIFKDFGKIFGDIIATISPLLDSLLGFIDKHKKGLLEIAKIMAIIGGALILGPILMSIALFIGALKLLEIALNFIAGHFKLFKNIVIAIILPLALPFIIVVGIIIGVFKLVEYAIKHTGNVFRDIGGFITDVVNTTAAVISSVFNAMVTVISTVMSAIWHFIEPILNFVKNLFIIVFGSILLVILTVMQVIKAVIIDAWNVVYAVVSYVLGLLWNGITVVWNAIYGVISTVIGFIWNTIVTAWNFWYGVISGVMNAIWGVVSTIWNAVYDVISGIAQRIFNFFAGAIGWLYGVGANIVQGLANGISAVAGAVWGAIKTVADQVGHFFAGAGGWLYGVGKSIVEGLAHGISDAIGDVNRAAGNVASAVQNKVKNLLGIHSPSRVFAEIGANVGAGFIQGIEGTQNSIDRTMSNMVSANTGTINIGSSVDLQAGMASDTASFIGGNIQQPQSSSSAPQISITLAPQGIVARSRSEWRDIMKDGLSAVNEELKARRLPLIADGNLKGSSTA